MFDRIAILTYHQVGVFPPSPRRHLYCHVDRFAAQTNYLRRHGYRVLSMDEAVACLKGERAVPARAVVLTFDDSYDNFLHYALPALARYRFPAMVYVPSGFIGQSASWYEGETNSKPAMLNRNQILELRRSGIDIGSHGVSHARLTQVDDARRRDELVRSKSELEQVLGEEVRHFCYPYGDHNATVVEAARAAGYRSAVTCVSARASRTHDPLTLPRKAIAYRNTLLGYFWKLHSP